MDATTNRARKLEAKGQAGRFQGAAPDRAGSLPGPVRVKGAAKTKTRSDSRRGPTSALIHNVRKLFAHADTRFFFFHFRMQHRSQFVRVGTKFGQNFGFSEPEYLTLPIHFGMLAAECFHCAIIL